ncbi:MAG: PEP/pyruvate-binding domain-containing protein, partial [Salinibacter sp.]
MTTTTVSNTRYTWSPARDADPPPLGGKGAALRALSEAGRPVPDWFAVSPAALRDSLAEPARKALSAGRLPADAPTDLTPAPAVREAVSDAVARTFGTGDDLRLAVRSSAPEEDAAEHSFAGQLESFLFVPPAAVPARVAAVWGSAFRASVREYRRSQGLDGTPPPPAVVVQRMVDPTRAGVAFSADPSGQRGRCVVAAVRGAGTPLVDGVEDGDTFRVDREGRVVDRTLRPQRVAYRRDREAGSGLCETTLPPDAGEAPALTDDEAAAVAELARRAERHFGRPQDIEWAWANDGTLYLLQSRPITNLSGQPDPDAPLRVWDNSNIAESYSGVTTPLTFSFARHAYEEVYRGFYRVMGVPPSRIEAHADTFRTMIGLIRGRIYYNLLSWYDSLSLLPGFRVTRAFMEDMMGVDERLPEERLPDREPASWTEWGTDALTMVRSAGRLLAQHGQLPRRIADFSDHLDAVLTPPEPGLDQMRLDELANYYRDLEAQLLERWDVPIANDFFAMIFHGLSRRLVEAWTDVDDPVNLHNNLLTGHAEVVSTEPARRMREMAEQAAGDDALVETLCSGSLPEIRRALKAHPSLRDRFESYLDRFSDRCLDELKLESPTLHDDPTPLYRGVGRLARRLQTTDLPPVGATEARLREDAEARLRDALEGHPLRRWVARWVLKHARGRVADRENLRFERTRVFGVCRRIFVEMGRRLHAEGLLDDPRDVFYLEVDEVLGVVEGTASTTDLSALVAARRAEFECYREAEPPPDRFRTRGAVHVHDLIEPEDDVPADADASTRLEGLGCCPGTVEGPVRVVDDPRDVALNGDEILVAKRTDPGWITLLAACRGLLVEQGNLLSHAAIVAREMGLPAVVSLPGLTERLDDGDVVRLDG